jgi:hypothetical protein
MDTGGKKLPNESIQSKRGEFTELSQSLRFCGKVRECIVGSLYLCMYFHFKFTRYSSSICHSSHFPLRFTVSKTDEYTHTLVQTSNWAVRVKFVCIKWKIGLKSWWFVFRILPLTEVCFRLLFRHNVRL